MVKVHQQLPFNNDGSVNIEQWVASLDIPEEGIPCITDACQLARLTGADHNTPYNYTCFLQGLETAVFLNELHLDYETLAAAILFATVEYTDLSIDDVESQLGKHVADLVKGTQQISMMTQIQHQSQNQQQVDNIRKMLLAMVRDVRVVVIKLADRLSMMRSIRDQESYIQHTIAQETMDIYAPLANRLGLHTIKWELEDLSFFYLRTDEYQEIAKNLSERRVDREVRVNTITLMIKNALKKEKITAEVYGRAKHIYSIKRKMIRKNVPFHEIYDAIAVRILLDHVDDCYHVLSIVHELWQPIEKEFDDYIAMPKPNGYQSIHTAVIGPDNKNFEIQIRTQEMHQNSEMGVAAHWMYKEGKAQQSAYEEKIAWLRNLLEWQKALSHDDQLPEELEKNVFEDRVYVFTPAGDIIDLPAHTTPLDFAYHIHTEVGHRCRGAKINGKIVQLTYELQTGDQIEILTSKISKPSRDWLNVQRGYLKTPTARAKVLNWFKKQDFEKHVETGRTTIERELERLGIDNANLARIADQLNFKTPDLMLAALGNGTLRITQITNTLHAEIEPKVPTQPAETVALKPSSQVRSGTDYVTIHGVGNLLSKIAKCCKPVPGDPIIGYITQGQGITIHHHDCKNIIYADETSPNRLVEVSWNDETTKIYPVDIEITAYDRAGLVRDVTAVFANEKINMTQLNSHFSKKENVVKIVLTIEIDNLEILGTLLDKLQQLPNVATVRRIRQGG